MHAKAAQHIVLRVFFLYQGKRSERWGKNSSEKRERNSFFFFFFSLGAIALSIHHVCENFNKPAKQSLSRCVAALPCGKKTITFICLNCNFDQVLRQHFND
jgi:hypothetical protein